MKKIFFILLSRNFLFFIINFYSSTFTQVDNKFNKYNDAHKEFIDKMFQKNIIGLVSERAIQQISMSLLGSFLGVFSICFAEYIGITELINKNRLHARISREIKTRALSEIFYDSNLILTSAQKRIDFWVHYLKKRKDFFSILLYGEPGNGKSTMIDYFALQLGRPIIYLESQMLSCIPENLPVEEVFLCLIREGRKRYNGESFIIVMDEADLTLKERSLKMTNEDKKVMEFFLTKLGDNDWKNKHMKGLILILSTNYPKNIDSALLRAGRLKDASERIENPNYEDILSILKSRVSGIGWEKYFSSFANILFEKQASVAVVVGEANKINNREKVIQAKFFGRARDEELEREIEREQESVMNNLIYFLKKNNEI